MSNLPRTKNWAPNPYAIARLLNDQADFQPLKGASGIDADNFLKKAFKLEKKRTLVQALKPFRDLAAAVKQPLPLERVVALPQYKDLLKDRRYKREQIQRVLPLLVQVADARFGLASSPGPGFLFAAPVVGSFESSDKLTVDQATYLDPIQGDTADCYLISAMIGLAWANHDLLRGSLNRAGFGAGSFVWHFHSHPPGPLSPVNVTSQVPKDGDFPLFARSSDPTEYWPSLLEKTYVVREANEAQQVLPNGEPSPANYQFIGNGDLPQNACRALVGGIAHPELLDSPPGQKIFSFSPDNLLRGALATESGIMSRPVMAWRNSTARDDPLVWENTGLVPDHAYTVLGVMQSADVVEHVVLRNPYGYPTDERRAGYKSGLWEPDRQPPEPNRRPPVTLNKNGVFAISRKLFYEHFSSIGWVDVAPAAGQPGAPI